MDRLRTFAASCVKVGSGPEATSRFAEVFASDFCDAARLL
jgi:hypothetical protein